MFCCWLHKLLFWGNFDTFLPIGGGRIKIFKTSKKNHLGNLNLLLHPKYHIGLIFDTTMPAASDKVRILKKAK